MRPREEAVSSEKKGKLFDKRYAVAERGDQGLLSRLWGKRGE